MFVLKKRGFRIVLTGILILSFTIIPGLIYGWSGSTHSFLVEQGMTILERDLGTTITTDPNFTTLKSYLADLKQGAQDPDNLANVALGGLTQDDWWSSHFYDPDTNACYSSTVPWLNAEYQTRRYIRIAVTDWKNGDYHKAVYLLGYACHFFADLNVPHHAANNTAFDYPYSHGDFETFVQNRQTSYTITTVADGVNPLATIYGNTVNNYNTMEDFLTDLSKKNAKIAKNNFYAYLNNATNDSSAWNQAAIPTMANAQKGLALIFYRFLQQLKLVRTLTVTVKTADELWAGTDNDIYFGMQLDNGAIREYLLDKTNDILGGAYAINTYNDFEQGNTDSYNIYFYDKSFDLSRVNGLWLRKAIYIVSDDWKAGSIMVSLDSVPVQYQNLNRWFYGNTQYNWAVNGLNPNNPSYIGTVDVTIRTADVLWAGTDDDIFFGMRLDDGRQIEILFDKTGYNDFERNDNDTYTFTVTDPTFQASQIRNLWLRKQKILGDDWKVYSIQVKMRGKVVYSQTINQWLTGNTTYNMPVNGLFY
jgi:phospholipase C/alpha-toxin